MNEMELSQGCCKGDNPARRVLYERYAGKMLALCYRYTGSTDVAQDLLHDGFIRIYTSFDSFRYRGVGSLQAWITRVFTNLSLEYLRKRDLLREGISLDVIAEVEDTTDPDSSNIPMEELMRFIAELPAGYRTVFNLYVFEEWSHKEIAAYLHIQEKSSASQFVRARQLLIRRIQEANY